MPNLNLLPPEQQKNFQHEIYGRIAQFFGLWLVILGIIFGALLAPSYIFVAFQHREVERARIIEEESQKASEARELEARIGEINKFLDVIIGREEEKRLVLPMLAGVLDASPPDIAISQISYDASRLRLTVSGEAEARSSLIAFIEALRKIPEAESVSSPVANIIKEEDIEFSIDIEVKS